MKKYFFSLLLSIFLLLSCSEETTKPNTNNNNNNNNDTALFSFSGTINNKKGIAIPPSARLIVFWSVSSGSPDYTYFWTEGKLDLKNNTFKISFDELPPDSCLNHFGEDVFGVALVLLVKDFTIGEGEIPIDDTFFNNLIGYINDRAVVYIQSTTDILLSRFLNFQNGYNFGKGWYNPQPGVFDGWENTDTNNIEIIIDDFENGTFPNWT